MFKQLFKGNSAAQTLIKSQPSYLKKFFSTSWKWEHLNLWEKQIQNKDNSQNVSSNSTDEQDKEQISSAQEEFSSYEPLRTSHQVTLQQQLPISSIKEYFNSLATKEKGTSFDDLLKLKAQNKILNPPTQSKDTINLQTVQQQTISKQNFSSTSTQAYEELKQLAKQRGMSVSEFVALSNLIIRTQKCKQTIDERLPKFEDDLKKEFQEYTNDQIAQILSYHVEIGGMSDGALSSQVHRHLTHAANKTGVLSNSGEGGVEVDRHRNIQNPLVIQCASGRFGFDLTSMIESDEVQIKLAQGAKPGEGGHLPGSKVSIRIAGIRRARKGTTLISPQPQHDLYSIEDLYLLIHALKSVKPGLQVNVKLASDPEVAITALGAVKAGADRITIAGHGGGTGAAKISSIFNTGMPWEWGVATTHQMLDAYDLRNKIQLVASGGIINGCDVVEAVLLGADKVEIGTSALVSLGCIMLRKCHSPRSISVESLIQPLQKIAKDQKIDVQTLARVVYDALGEAGYIEVSTGAVSLDYQEMEDRHGKLDELDLEESLGEIARKVLENASGGCTVGLNTQDPLYIKKYEGTPEKAQDFLLMLGLGALQYMKEKCNQKGNLYKLRGRAKEFLQSNGFFEDMNLLLDFKNIFKQLKLGKIQLKAQKGYIDTLLQIPSDKDIKVIEKIQNHISQNKNTKEIPTLNITDLIINQSDISFGSAISGYCQYHNINFPIRIHLKAENQVGPQNFGCFLRKNITLIIEGSCNDHVGKANSGGKIVVKQKSNKLPVIVGNSIGFGSTAGEMYIDGSSGTRSFVRNSGMNAVVTGNVNDHFCEFMTCGNVVVLGEVGRNCGAGMTGGYLFLNIDIKQNKQNTAGKRLLSLEEHSEPREIFKTLVENCYKETQSEVAKKVLDNWSQSIKQFKVFNPYNLNYMLESDYINLNKNEAQYELFPSDQGVCESLAKLYNSKKRQTPFVFKFSGQAGNDFASYSPLTSQIQFEGRKLGQFVGYASKGTTLLVQSVVNKASKEEFTGRYAFMRSSGHVYIKSDNPLGHHSFFQFNGTAVINNTGNESCHELRKDAKILILGEVGTAFAKNSHPDSLIIVNKDKVKNINDDSLASLTDKEVRWVQEQLIQFKRLKNKSESTKSKPLNNLNDSPSNDILQNIQDSDDTFAQIANIQEIQKYFGRFIHEKDFFSYKNIQSKENVIKLAKNLLKIQQASGWNAEIQSCIESIAKSGLDEMTYSMGDQLSFFDRFMNNGSATNFYGLFRQPFAQETRPPVDADSEGSFITTDIYIKSHHTTEQRETYIKFDHPIISSSQLEQLIEHINPIEVELRSDVCEIQVAEMTVEEKIDQILKQIRNEIVVGNKRVILFTHRLKQETSSRTNASIEDVQPDSKNLPIDKMHLDSWIIISLVRQRLKKEGIVDFDVVLETDEPIEPHSLDVLLNVCGVKLVQPRAVEKHFTVLASKFKDLRGATFTQQELWNNYALGMQKALKRIIAKDGDVDLSTRVYSQTYTCLYLSKKLAYQIGVQSFFCAESFNLSFITSIFQHRFMGTISNSIISTNDLQNTSKVQPELPKGIILKSTKKFQHLWDNKRVDALQTLVNKPNLESFQEYFEKEGKVNVREHFKERGHTKSIAIIGAGPAGLETAIQLSNNYQGIDEIVLFDSYYAPGGKIIDAVAPDHPITKKQLKNFSIFEHEKIKFVGNSYINQRRMRYIYEQFSAVFLTHGATPRKLGENITNREYVHQADDFVRWYNSKTDMNATNTEGVPFYRTELVHPQCPFNIQEAKAIAIIGVGNVTLDIARILLRNPDDPILKDNITTYVYGQLKKSRVRVVTCIGRKEPQDARFGMPELLELKDLAVNEKQFVLAAQFDMQSVSANIDKIKQKLSKKLTHKNKTAEIGEQSTQGDDEIVELQSKLQLYEFFKEFYMTQEQIDEIKQNTSTKIIHFVFNEDIDPVKGFEKQSNSKKVIGNFVSGNTIEADAFLASLGYQPHMPISNILQITPQGQAGFSATKSQQSQAGTITNTPTYVVPNLFVAGQAKTGIGTIGHTKSDVKNLLKNFDAETLQAKPSVEGFLEDHYYKQGSVSKEIVLQIMQSIRAHYTQKYITPSVIKKHIENFRKIQYKKSINEQDTTRGQATMNKSVQQADSQNQTPRKLKLLADPNDTTAKEIELPISDKSLRDCLNIREGDCESGSCGGCYLFTSDPVDQYEQAEQKIAISKGGLNESTIPSEHKAILSCQHTVKDLMSDRITKLILAGSNRSSCGIGVHRAQEASTEFVQDAVRHLKDDVARGAGVSGYGDGAGLLLKIDWDFFENYGGFSQIILENFEEVKKSLAICQVFIRDKSDIKQIEDKLTRQRLAVIHKREVIINQNKFVLGEARQHPQSYQFFVAPQQPNTLEKIISKIQQNPHSIVNETDALASISTKYVCYKLASFASEIEAYEDLNPKYGYKADTILTHTRFATTTLQPQLTGNVVTAAIKAHPFQNLIHNGEIVTKRSIISYLEKNTNLFKQKGILIDRDELSKCSDSYVLQRYIQCLKSIYPDFSLADIIHMITRSTRYNSPLAIYARAKGMPQVCGPCNLSMYDEQSDSLVFFRDNSGFRPAICVSQEDEIHVVSQQQCQSLDDKVSLLKEGQIYVIQSHEAIKEYIPNDSKVPHNFQIKTLSV